MKAVIIDANRQEVAANKNLIKTAERVSDIDVSTLDEHQIYATDEADMSDSVITDSIKEGNYNAVSSDALAKAFNGKIYTSEKTTYSYNNTWATQTVQFSEMLPKGLYHITVMIALRGTDTYGVMVLPDWDETKRCFMYSPGIDTTSRGSVQNGFDMGFVELEETNSLSAQASLVKGTSGGYEWWIEATLIRRDI